MRKHLQILQVLLFIFLSAPAHSQSLRWGASGGSADGSPGGPDETITDVATDPNGNIYVLGNAVGPTSLNVKGNSLAGYGSQDIILSSFKCDGTYRWSKVLGGSDLDIPASLRTDASGGVYVEGYFSTHYITIHLGGDTTWATGSSYKALFLAKYDTAGNYKWLSMPQPDTAGIYSPAQVRALDMDVDSAGNVYAMFGLTPGAYAGGSFVAATKGVYVLKYNSAGTFQGGTPLQITYDAAINGSMRMKTDFRSGNYYVTGNISDISNLQFNGTSISMPLFIGSFNSSGNLLWQRTNTSGLGQSFGRANLDAQHNIYLAGVSQAFGGIDTFNSYPVINTVTTMGNAPIVVKMDSTGNNIWVKNGSSNHAVYLSSLALNGSTVTAAGSYNGKLVFTGLDSFYHPTAIGEGYDIFVLSLDASSGTFTKVDSIPSEFSSDEFATAMAADKHGNVYIGGSLSGAIYANTDSMSNIGGGSDFFIAKYGYDNCGCTTTPVANYTHSGKGTINFTYTGTTAGLDSVVWNFGDDNTARGTTASHSYAAAGDYWVCATAYTACGSNAHCDSVSTTTAVNDLSLFPGLKIYPNPFSNMIMVQHADAGDKIMLYDIMGTLIYHTTLTTVNQQINTDQLAPGAYLLQIIDARGNQASMVLTK